MYETLPATAPTASHAFAVGHETANNEPAVSPGGNGSDDSVHDPPVRVTASGTPSPELR